ncbi:MAG: 30S ribosomal protein S21 [Candidatus Pacebacteria bacterium]|nr:30S ribosomal protein S21 [Candidatus Paceibacterota bacterium]
MPLEVKKQERESAQGLIRRFTKAVKKSGILIEARRRRFFVRPLSDKSKKKIALRKLRVKEEYTKKDKLGLIKSRYGEFNR